MTVHLFGATSSPGCSNYALKSTANDNEKDIGSEAAEFLRRDFYVDDGLKSVSTEPKAISLMKKTQEMCRRGGFNLHKIISNKKEVLEAIPWKDRAQKIRKFDLNKDDLPTERALGIQWCTERDEFQFSITLQDRPCTRRGILSIVSSIFDPLGFIAPVLLEGKKILQELCKEKMDWDEPVPETFKLRWKRWKSDLFLLEKFSVKRCQKPENFGSIAQVQLHSFSDASTSGYGQCTYLRLKDDRGRVYCSLVMAKARVTPLKLVTIPRLELTAALISVKISGQLKKELNYEEIEEVFWTDSKVVLGYIANEPRRFHIFVANRVQQIQDQTSSHQWRYIESKQNPADIASRGIRASELFENSKWIAGPDFLWRDESEWNATTTPSSLDAVELSEDDPDVRRTVALATGIGKPKETILDRVERFSDWQRLRRVVALCIRYLQKLQNQVINKEARLCVQATNRNKVINHRKTNGLKLEPMTVDEIQEAETRIIRAIQNEIF